MKLTLGLSAVTLVLAFGMSSHAFGGEASSSPKWGDKGVLEYSGSATINIEQETGQDLEFEVSLYPSIGWFVADGFQLGIGPRIGYSKQGDVDVTSFGAVLEPRYVFMRDASVRPSASVIAGFIRVDASGGNGASYSETAILFGGGPSIAIPFGDPDGHGHLNVGLSYVMTRATDAKTTNHRVGLDLGVSFWD